MEGVSTDSLRALAPKWSLAGDDQLLSLLQNTHQKLISKCQDVNSKLEEMASALDDASINLQNVNNKFMALSNSQFIESRVYEDDADLATDVQPVTEQPQKPPVDEITMLKSTLAILERSHETAEILDDSDSDSDVEISVVLKPKDMYAHRPLPYIIGTQQWKNKWHAGLIVEDSDTDSSTSKQDRDIEQYSDSEEEISRPPLEEENTVSESSSSLPGSVETSQPVSRPADIAAALAKRLAGDTNMRVQEEPPEYSPPVSQVTKVYKPEQPATSAIFPDEPPPLDESTDQSSDEDIFAEINKHTPYTQRNKVQSNLAEDLFSFEKPVESGDIFSDFANTHVEKQPVKQKSTLFEEESEPELFAEPTKKEPPKNTVEKDEPSSKKPVGGISLFGSNKGAESIGAAILKRNQRKSSTSGDESGSEDLKIQNDNITKRIPEKSKTPDNNDQKGIKTTDEIDNKSVTKKEKDIFDDLFSKPETKQKTAIAKPVKAKVTPVKENVTAVKEKEKTNIKDLFSDNIFDDIDDIFTSNVKIPKESNQKSIFDDDDLFSDIDISKSTNQKKDTKESGKDTSIKDAKPSIKSKSIFDSDDELFSDIKTENAPKSMESHAAKVVDKNVDSEVVSKTEAIKKPIETTKERNLFDDSPQIAKPDPKPQIKSKSIFDSDSDDDIFAKIKTDDNKKTEKGKNVTGLSKNENEALDEENIFKTDSTNKNINLLTTDSLKTKEKGVERSPSLFEEEEIDDLFIAANKLKSKENIEQNTVKVVEENITVIENEQENLFASDIVSKTDEVKKSEPEQVQDIVSTKNDILGDGTNVVATKNDIFGDFDDPFSKSKEDLLNKPIEKVTDDIKPTQEEIKSEVKTAIHAKLNTIAESSVEDTNDTLVKVDLGKTEKIEEVNVKQTVFDDITPVKKNDEKHEPKAAPKENIFDDIFTEPPAFEKPAESKKSKNVNALFDDDSDDESLFFKKTDVISDEKPEIFSQNANFDIFVDEPPAIDVDFSPKSAENEEVDDDLFSNALKTDKTIKTYVVNEDKDIFSPKPEVPNLKELDNNEDFESVPGTEKNVPDNVIEVVKENTIDDKPDIANEVSKSKPISDLFTDEDKDLFSPAIEKSKEKPSDFNKDIDSDDELFASLPSLPKTSQKDQTNTLVSNINEATVEKKETDDFDDIFKSKSPQRDTEVKKIGKLNTKNFNINVNALIPGASPKKIPKETKEERKPESYEPEMVNIIPDETDFEPKPTTNKSENEVKNWKEQEPVKSITFDEKSDPSVLDNNLSKQRPKIQVKRRPSTRKARHEAVRKSAIDFGDDTDNSSSLEEPVPSIIKKEENTQIKNEEIINKPDIFARGDSIDEIDTNISKETKTILNESNISPKNSESLKSVPKEKDIAEATKTTKEIKNSEEKRNSEEKSDIFQSILTNVPQKKPEASFISNETKDSTQTNKKTTKVVYILNDEDIFDTQPKLNQTKDIFSPENTETNIETNTEGIKTLGKVCKEETEKSKEDLPNKDKINKEDIQKEVKSQKQTLFDDSDEELFNKNKKITKKVTIFDSDSEEDLFTGKSKEKKNKEVRNKEVKERKEVKEVRNKEVKGSLFGDDDDDDDLFGVKKNKSEPKPQASTPSTSKETYTSATTASKTAEPVFNDPLSMLGDDD